MTKYWQERLRRTAGWRLRVRGLQVAMVGMAVAFFTVVLHVLRVPKTVLETVLQAGSGVVAVGFGLFAVGTVLLMGQDAARLNATSTEMAAIFMRDVLRLRAPQPVTEPAWPPPQWCPVVPQQLEPDGGSGRRDDGASGG